MDDSQSLNVIEYDDLWYESEIALAVHDFPAQRLKLEARRSPAAEYQFGGIFETVVVTLDPLIVQSLLGIGGAFLAGVAAKVGTATGEKIVELLTEDAYEWVKRLIKRLGEKFSRDPFQKGRREPKKGVRVHIRSSDENKISCIFHLIYSHDDGPFNPSNLNDGLHIFELMLRPVISAISTEEEIRGVIIQGWLGPGEDNPHWAFVVNTNNGDHYFPSFSAEGEINWQDGSEEGATKLRSMLAHNPGGRADGHRAIARPRRSPS